MKKHPTLLYAEDNAGMRKMVTHYLSSAGMMVEAVSDGDEAIEAAKQKKYDFILLDITMERVDGLTATRAIRNTENLNQNTPIIGLTGRTEANEVETFGSAGMDEVLKKPVDLEFLLETLNNVTALHSNVLVEDEEELEQYNFEKYRINSEIVPKILDLEVLERYRRIAGPQAVEGILRDFSDLWARKVGELYSSLILNDNEGFARAGDEMAAIAGGIGAGRVALQAAHAVGMQSDEEKQQLLPKMVLACHEVQQIINQLANLPPKPPLESLFEV